MRPTANRQQIYWGVPGNRSSLWGVSRYPSMVIVVTKVVAAVGLAAGLGGLGLGVSAVANADGMNLTVSPDQVVDSDGTQGNFDSDGDQDAFLVSSPNADEGMTTASQ